jgi:hypothetical protein
MITKEETKKKILETDLYKDAIKNIPEEEQKKIEQEIQNIVDIFYNNFIIPFEKLNL